MENGSHRPHIDKTNSQAPHVSRDRPIGLDVWLEGGWVGGWGGVGEIEEVEPDARPQITSRLWIPRRGRGGRQGGKWLSRNGRSVFSQRRHGKRAHFRDRA
jgi:hypothetical protein